MQKLNPKKSIILLGLAVAVFCGVGRVVLAADSTTGQKFEVSLQTPFSAPPTDKNCEKDSETTATTKSTDGTTIYWVCEKDSIVWKQVIGGKDGQEILTNYAGLIYKWLAGLIGVVAVLMIVVGGLEIATAGANQNGLQSGRDRIFAALLGLAILFSASLILYTINPNFFTNSTETSQNDS